MPKRVIGVVSAKLSYDARVPNKIMLPLAHGATMLEHHCQRMYSAVEKNYIDAVYIATSRMPGNEIVCEMADRMGVGVLAGSETDVIARHIAICEKENADAVIRIPCDSPLFDWEVIDKLTAAYEISKLDEYIYVSNVPYMCSTMPELISYEGLKKAHELYQGPAVSLPIWKNWKDFKVTHVTMPDEYVRPEYRLCVDTPMEYVVMAHIYYNLYKGLPIDLLDAYRWLDNNPWCSHLAGAIENSAINKEFLEAQKNAQA